MPELQTFERIAELLESPQRERFLAAVARFRNVPEDDEYLQVIEAIGFMTLVWTKVPNQVHSILEGCKPAAISVDFFRGQLREILAENIPSFDDLRQLAQTVKNLQTIQARHTPGVTKSPALGGRIPNFVAGLLVGIALSNLILALANILPW